MKYVPSTIEESSDEKKIINEKILQVGQSKISGGVTSDVIKFKDHYSQPISRTTLGEKFDRLSATWQYNNSNISAVNEIAIDPAYQEIIGMGEKIIPVILEELKDSSAQWFWALAAISGENPVKSTHRGDIKKMTKDWLNWGRDNNHIE